MPPTSSASHPTRRPRTPLRGGEFNQRIGSGPDVGIWHELYTIRPGDFEAIYANMPKFGLAAATGHVPVGDGSRTSKQRMAKL